jgi:hypothetical protein
MAAGNIILPLGIPLHVVIETSANAKPAHRAHGA